MNKRPTFLTIWLVLLTIGRIHSLYLGILAFAKVTKIIWSFLPLIVFAFHGMLVINLVGIVMLWRWKKLGFYIVVVSQILAALISVIVKPDPAGIIVVVLALLSAGILYLAMRPVWKNFK